VLGVAVTGSTGTRSAKRALRLLGIIVPVVLALRILEALRVLGLSQLLLIHGLRGLVFESFSGKGLCGGEDILFKLVIREVKWLCFLNLERRLRVGSRNSIYESVCFSRML
jgi:hypothetical protein